MADFSMCCRLCLSEKLDTIKSIFDDAIDDRTLPQKILASVAIEITSEDKLTTMICNQCIETVNNYYIFKKSCSENQKKLEEWFKMNTSDANIQIKDEPIEAEPPQSPDVIISGEIPVVKSEPIDDSDDGGVGIEEDAPPPLTPQDQHNVNNDDDIEMDLEVVDAQNDKSQIEKHQNKENQQNNDAPMIETNPRRCTICEKEFCSVANRKRHERGIHGIDQSASADVSISQDEQSQSSIESQVVPNTTEPTAEEKKILFAAGLKLLQTNSTPPISLETLSKLELSYIEKCKAMAVMYRSLVCACHSVPHPNLKGLLSHLRSIGIWFPVFTCYQCMITFTDRSSSTRHNLRCTRTNLETLVKLSNLKKRSEVKTRLYQNYKCTKCRFMYSFHEDFCRHVDEEHSDITFPMTCTCGRIFTNLEDYKDHAYVSCLVDFYCDICHITVKTLDAFQKHAIENHDNSEGFALVQEDGYRRRRERCSLPHVSAVKREHSENNIIYGKRRSTFYKQRFIDSEEEYASSGSGSKVINPLILQKIPGKTCPICSRVYASNNNMLRHYRSHMVDDKNDIQGNKDDSLYCCPDCGGMFTSDEWEKHKEQHKKKVCNECGKVFQFQSELEQHRSVHLNLKVYRDSKTQSYRSTMASPNNTDTNIVVMCEICDTIFPTKEQLKEHKLTHDSQQQQQQQQHDTEEEDAHSQGSSNGKKYKCTICNKGYAAYGGLWEHNRKKHPENKSPYCKDFPKECKACDKLFYTGGSWYMHKMMHERTRDNVLTIKQQKQQKATTSSASSSPYLHVDDEAGDDDTESYHTCKRCFKVFSNRYNLKNHMKSHGINLHPVTKTSLKGKGKKVWCDVCHAPFDSSQQLQQHKSEEHAETEDTMPSLSDEQEEIDVKAPFVVFTCDVCVQTFTTKLSLKKHKEKHAQERGGLFMHPTKHIYCKYCKITFTNANQLNYHMRQEHNETTTTITHGRVTAMKIKDKSKHFACNLCKKPFQSSSALYAHMGWHKRGKVYEQYVPETRAPIKVKIKQEAMDTPPSVPQFKCNTCKAVLPNDTALQIHILEKHRDINAIVLPTTRCNMCNLDFSSHDDYEQHKRLHNIVEQPRKTFPCNHCPAAFSRIETLNAHLKQYHLDEIKQEYNCPQCNRIFDKQSSLTIHLKVHEKQRMSAPSRPLFSCSICNLGFNLPKDLRAHTIKAHPF